MEEVLIESLQNMDTLIPRLLPVVCLLILYLGIRIKFADMVNNVSGQVKQSGSFIRSILSLALIAASIMLWLLGSQAIDWSKAQMKLDPPTQAQVSPSLPFNSPAPAIRTPIKRTFYPTILSATKKGVIIDSKGKVMSIQQGMRTPSGWLLTSSKSNETIFLDDQNLEVIIRYHESKGKWMPIQ